MAAKKRQLYDEKPLPPGQTMAAENTQKIKKKPTTALLDTSRRFVCGIAHPAGVSPPRRPTSGYAARACRCRFAGFSFQGASGEIHPPAGAALGTFSDGGVPARYPARPI